MLGLIALFILGASALYTPKGSPCGVPCGTKSRNFTGTGDLVCLDTQYSTQSGDATGILFEGCLDCLSNSTYFDTSANYYSNSDQWWYLWHMHYVQQYCLIDTPQTTAASNCASVCDPMSDAVTVSWIYNGTQEQYGYCNFNGSQFTSYAQSCASCLQDQSQGVVIGNFMNIMYDACQDKPMIQQNQLVTSTRPLFDSALATATSSLSTPSAATTANASATTSSTAQSTSTTVAQETSAGISGGAVAGIVIAAIVMVIALVAGVFLLIRRRKQSSQPHGTVQYAEIEGNKTRAELAEKNGWSIPKELDARDVQLHEMDTR